MEQESIATPSTSLITGADALISAVPRSLSVRNQQIGDGILFFPITRKCKGALVHRTDFWSGFVYVTTSVPSPPKTKFKGKKLFTSYPCFAQTYASWLSLCGVTQGALPVFPAEGRTVSRPSQAVHFRKEALISWKHRGQTFFPRNSMMSFSLSQKIQAG